MEQIPTSFEKKTTKADVIVAFRKFIDKGVVSPDSLDLNDPEVIKANKVLDAWAEQEEKISAGNRETRHKFNFERTMIVINAGFRDPGYLRDVLGWLDQDLENVDEESPEPLPKIAEQIRIAKAQIEDMLVKE